MFWWLSVLFIQSVRLPIVLRGVGGSGSPGLSYTGDPFRGIVSERLWVTVLSRSVLLLGVWGGSLELPPATWLEFIGPLDWELIDCERDLDRCAGWALLRPFETDLARDFAPVIDLRAGLLPRPGGGGGGTILVPADPSMTGAGLTFSSRDGEEGSPSSIRS